jgi:hypothetical protein
MFYVIMYTYLSSFFLPIDKATNVFHLLINIALHNESGRDWRFEIHDPLSINLPEHFDIAGSTSISIPMFQLSFSFCFKEIWARKY